MTQSHVLFTKKALAGDSSAFLVFFRLILFYFLTLLDPYIFL